MNKKHKIKEIISLVEQGDITPDEGRLYLEQLKQHTEVRLTPRTGAGEKVWLDKPTSVQGVQLRSVPVEKPNDEEVKVLVKAFSINFGDLLCVKGLYPMQPEYPFTPGFEFAGIVQEVGKNVKGLNRGDEVIGLTGPRMGAHSSIVITDSKLIVKKPRKLSFEEASSFPVAFLTNQMIFEKANIQPGEKILIQTAAGGTGLIAVQMAQLKGAEVYATAGSREKLNYLQKMGVENLILYKETDFASEILDLTNGYGVDVVINTLSNEAVQKGLDILAPEGRYIEIAIGALGGSYKYSLGHLVENQSFHSINIRKLLTGKSEEISSYLKQMVDILELGQIKPQVGRVFPFSEIKEAYHYLENGKNIGKVVIKTDAIWDSSKKDAEDLHEVPKEHSVINPNDKLNRDIAIVGMSGKFPGADNLEEFWENLKNGHCAINEVPRERWLVEEFYDPDPKKLDKTSSKWGGFLRNIDQFDAKFFNISGKEADLTDPQQRIFLETCWNALEDAGYATEDISNKKCGVFVGTSGGDYLNKMQEDGTVMEPQAFWGNSLSVLAARISYFLNLKGPSLSIDTACSSSLVAIHLGCQSILSGESEMAIAGGIFISLTPAFIILSSNAGMLSPTGQCKTFDDGADGFVPGEGAGAIILKSLDAAVRDNDHIYGVIKGSAINQDGKTNGLTAPSTLSQTQVELSAYRQAGINPRSIQFIEAHGTGTKLGDPIEVEALTNAFGHYTSDKQFCKISSVKTNIGHTASAAGVASVLKVLLSLKHKKLPPNVNFQRQNSHIEFEKTPFQVVEKLEDWPAIQTPRRAGVSSFGFSGTNAHLLIEEAPAPKKLEAFDYNYFIVPLSAKSKKSHESALSNFYNWLTINKDEYRLADIAYSLQTSRAHFSHHTVLLVQSTEELLMKLRRLLENEMEDGVHQFHVKQNAIKLSEEDNEFKQFEQARMKILKEGAEISDQGQSCLQIIGLYEKGYEIPWKSLWHENSVQKVPLPTYSFNYQSYWYDKSERKTAVKKDKINKVALHPLVDANISTLKETQFSLNVSGEEFYLKDHIVQGKPLMPAAAFLEMAMGAANYATNSDTAMMKNVMWINPFSVTEASQNLTTRFKQESTGITYEIFSMDSKGVKAIHSRGLIKDNDEYETIEPLSIDHIQAQCNSFFEGEECYKAFAEVGFDYGYSFQTIEKIGIFEGGAIAEINLPADSIPASSFVLHPALMDGALQTIMGYLLLGNSADKQISLPFSLESIKIYGNLSSGAYAYIREVKNKNIVESGMRNYNILIADHQGQVIVKVENFMSRSIASISKKENEVSKEREDLLAFKWKWKEKTLTDQTAELLKGNILIWTESEQYVQAIKQQSDPLTQVVWVQPAGNFGIIERDQIYSINPVEQDDYVKLLTVLKDKKQEPNYIVFHDSNSTSVNTLNIKEQIEQKFHPLFFLTKAIGMTKIVSQKMSLIYSFINSLNQTANPLDRAVGAFLKSASLEIPNMQVKSIEYTDSFFDKPDKWAKTIATEAALMSKNSVEIKYTDQSKSEKEVEEFQLPDTEPQKVFRRNGTYIITGGMGGIGYEISKYLASEFQAKLILLGRSYMGEGLKQKVERLRTYGCEVSYMRVDVSLETSMQSFVEKITTEHSGVHGIFHCAGLTKDKMLVNKSIEDLNEVIGAKIIGTTHLVRMTQQLKPDFIALFSSVAEIRGNIGQADYAYANGFMNSFAECHEDHMGQTKILSIGWPLWKDGGMQLNEHAERMFREKTGMTNISTESGLEVLKQGLSMPLKHFSVMVGSPSLIRNWLGSSMDRKEEKETHLLSEAEFVETDNKKIEQEGSGVYELYQTEVIGIVSALLRIDIEEIDYYGELSEYGFDSLLLADFALQLGQTFHIDLTPASVFGHSSIGGIADFIFEEHRSAIAGLLNEREKVSLTFREEKQEQNKLHETVTEPEEDLLKLPELVEIESLLPREPHQEEKEYKNNTRYEPIAIIGMSGKMPESENMSAYWEHLKNGDHMVSLIPEERWSWEEHYGDPDTEINKTDIKWGAFLKDVDKFDPLFFGISPREAEMMDPQQRIFLETVWSTLEDAGYRASDLAGTDTGLFVGVASNDYTELLQKQHAAVDAQTSTGMSHCILPNRISYLLDLHGPSEPVNTACSSSLVAIHRAVESIQNGHCKMAIAGGVNVILTPTLHVSFSKNGMLAQDGRCKTFDHKADGYVRGEGTGAVLLKSLQQAVQDGDHIYAVIKGSAINHGGRTNSLTAPNPHAQADLLVKAYEKAGFDPSTISYIEAHGTGTNLGDPVEINGLKSAFTRLYQSYDKEFSGKPHIGIGSVKTNIGHLEAAAGIAGIFKVVLAMKNGIIPSNLHFEKMNPYIELNNSPFYIVEKSSPWETPKDPKGKPALKRAGVSSFGFGGVNCHIVLEEYVEQASQVLENRPEVVVLSARSESQLRDYCRSLRNHIVNENSEDSPNVIEGENIHGLNRKLTQICSEILNVPEKEIDLSEDIYQLGFSQLELSLLTNRVSEMYGIECSPTLVSEYRTLHEISQYLLDKHIIKSTDAYKRNLDLKRIAFTLQTGREAFDYKVAFVAESVKELVELLEQYENQSLKISKNIFQGKSSNKKSSLQRKELPDHFLVEEAMESYNAMKLAELWVTGAKIPWKLIHSERDLKKLSLPTYPFSKESYWLAIEKSKNERPQNSVLLQKLHQLRNGEITIEQVKNSMGGL
ncbi:SDR family NAD(P)-dependent oxidoreductase [Saccharibacillus sacchari]|uniref:SDR family NAD(P)-dependent oxidoreductase n=1 Tax=Saccharibacillus sacchari TaxID=456493 RepID=A0ACC6P6V4_9BACL